jgi:hypothetical protein
MEVALNAAKSDAAALGGYNIPACRLALMEGVSV